MYLSVSSQNYHKYISFVHLNTCTLVTRSKFGIIFFRYIISKCVHMYLPFSLTSLLSCLPLSYVARLSSLYFKMYLIFQIYGLSVIYMYLSLSITSLTSCSFLSYVARLSPYVFYFIMYLTFQIHVSSVIYMY